MILYPVVEQFVSINGEGTKAGELAVFIRFRKCNLRCSYCDTKWANSDSSQAKMLTADDITEYVKNTHIKNVTLTGGEPLLQKDIAVLITMLIKNGSHVEIETNGSICLKELANSTYRPYFTMDYKLPSSGMEHYMNINNFDYLSEQDTVKFVAGSIEDLNCAKEIIQKYSLTKKCKVYFSPVFGKIEPSVIIEFMKANRMNDVRLQLQMHKLIWDPNERGV